MTCRIGYRSSVLLALLATVASAQTTIPDFEVDVILEWNDVALRANAFDHTGPDVPGNQLSNTQGPPASARVLAMVHVAMFDAYNSIDTRCAPYATNVNAAPGASIDAAVAQAAHDTLAALIPAGAPIYAAALQKTFQRVPDLAARASGVSVGQAVAQAILLARAGDTAWLGGTYTPLVGPGFHNVDPTNPAQNFISPLAGGLTPFGVVSVAPYRASAPPPITSWRYARAFNQVRNLGKFRGGNSGTVVPTTDETYVVANYWSYNGSPGTGTPPRLYNQIVRIVAIKRGNEVHENARLFALVNIAMADGGISAWDSKYTYHYWRPILGIREAGSDGNPLTHPIPDWVPLGGSRSNPFIPGERNFTPPFPAYTSGHATFGAAAMKTLANFYQTDDIAFTFVSDEWNGTTLDQFGRVRPLVVRSYKKLSHAAAENAASRVLNGVHWSYDGVEGVRSGNGIANEIFDTRLRPIAGAPPSIPNENFARQIRRILRRAKWGQSLSLSN